MNLGLLYILLQDNFHSSPFYSRFPDPLSEREGKKTHHISKADLSLEAMAGSWFSSFSPRRNKEEPLGSFGKGKLYHRAERPCSPPLPGNKVPLKHHK